MNINRKVVTHFIPLAALTTLMFCSTVFAQSSDITSAQQINAANELVRAGKVAEAIETYQQVPADPKLADELNYNTAVAQYRSGDVASAEKLFMESASSADTSIAANSRYNLGNCFYGKAVQLAETDKPAAIWSLREAINHYRGALRGDPNNPDARANIELATELIRKLEEEQKKEEQQKQEQQQDQKQDQQNQDQQQQDSEDQSNQSDSQKSDSENKDSKSEDQKSSDSQNSDQQQTDEQKNSEQKQSDQQQSGQKDSQGKDSEQKDPEKKDSAKSDSQDSKGDQQDQSEHQGDNPSDEQEGSDAKQQNQSQPNNKQQQARNQQQPDEAATESDEEAKNNPVPTGELQAAGDQDENQKPNGSVAMADPNGKDGVMSKEEAMKMLQAVRDRDMLRRLRQEQIERSRHTPVDRDW